MGWFGIVRLGLVQAALGSMIVLATSTMNRVMVVELALPAIVPGALVAFHYLVQLVRPRFGHGSDVGGRRTPWIVGGMAILMTGGIGAALATALVAEAPMAGLTLAVVAFALIGIGAGAAGTSLLVLMSTEVEARRRPAAASIVWIMMIAGFVITAATASRLLEPFSFARLVAVTTGAGTAAFLLTLLAVWRVERGAARPAAVPSRTPFFVALRQVWQEPRSRRFAIFVFVSMLGYSAQELILEPYAGTVFHLSPGETTGLTGVQHAGALGGMLLAGLLGTVFGRGQSGAMRFWTVAGCLGSAAGLVALAAAGFVGPSWPLRPSVFCLGLANGAFAVSAVGAMMGLAGDGRQSREGVRMGLWGAAQAIAFALGGFAAAGSSDLARHWLGSPVTAYALVFVAEACFFIVAAGQALQVFRPVSRAWRSGLPSGALASIDNR
jgi:BCD family chlorophyll transporter-like MFS transporter